MVEWKKIKDVCSNICSGGTPNTKNKDYYYGDIPWLRTQEVDWGNIYDTEIKISQKGLDNSSAKIIEKDCVIVAMYGATAAKVAINKIPLSTNQACCNLKINKDISCYRYVYYWLCKEYHKLKALGEGSQNNISGLKIKDYPIPIPSLSEQNRIVGILDTFTDSIENLKQQIAQRRKQYEHYREILLDLEGKPKEDIKKFGDYCVMIKGNGVQKTDFVDEGIGCIHYGQIYTHYGSFTYSTNKFVSKEVFEKAKKASKGDIIMTDTSENVEDICKSVAYLGEDDIAVSNHALIIKHEQNPKFLSYSTLTSSFFNQKRKVVFGVKVSGIKPDHLAQIQIYLPVIEEQNRIVSILDTFEASISNLEAQQEQRQKQYEYYRNKLLSFEKEEQ